MERMERLEVEINLQFELPYELFGQGYGEEIRAAMIAEYAGMVTRAFLLNQHVHGKHQGYARIKGAIEERHMCDALKKDWLENSV